MSFAAFMIGSAIASACLSIYGYYKVAKTKFRRKIKPKRRSLSQDAITYDMTIHEQYQNPLDRSLADDIS